jgi:hypothetical protein
MNDQKPKTKYQPRTVVSAAAARVSAAPALVFGFWNLVIA